MRSEGGNALTERPAQGTGETPHGSFCLPESHCEESQEQGFKVPSVVVDSTELVKHAHVDCSPTELARSVVLGAVQGLWSRCYRLPGVGAEDSTDGVAVPVPTAEYLVELSGVSGTPEVNIFEARKHVAREPSERIGDLSGVVSVRQGVL